MQILSPATVLGRTRAGQAVVLGSEGLSPAQAHLLMRLNGYTPLSELVCADEQGDMMMAAMQLMEAGLAASCRSGDEVSPRSSQWGSLLSADAAGG